MPLRTQRQVLLGKLEPTSSYGSDPTLDSGSNVINAWNIEFTKEWNPINLKAGDRSVYYDTQIGQQLGTLSFDIYMARAKTAGTIGELTTLLLGCGYDPELATINSFDNIGAADQASGSSVYFSYFNDGMVEDLAGCRGTAIWHIETGTVPYVHFDFQGLYIGAPSASTCPSNLTYLNGPISVVKDITLEVGSNYHTKMLEFTDGNIMNVIGDANSTYGVYQIVIVDCEPKATCDCLVDTVANGATLEGLVTAGSETSITYEYSASTDPKIVLTTTPESYARSDDGGTLRYDFSFIIEGIAVELEYHA